MQPNQLAKVDIDKVLQIRYEDFVKNGDKELRTITDFLGVAITDEQCQQALSQVKPGSVGKGRKAISPEMLEQIMPLMESTLRQYEYHK